MKSKGNWKKDTSRKKSCGDRNIRFNGSMRERKTPNFFTGP
jgi:hypothetical protein